MTKFKKSKTKSGKSQGVYTEIRHLGVLVENVNDSVRLVAEQHGDIKKALNAQAKILDSHTEMIGRLAINLEIIKEDVEFIKNSLKKKIDIEEFAALERRVVLLERRR